MQTLSRIESSCKLGIHVAADNSGLCQLNNLSAEKDDLAAKDRLAEKVEEGRRAFLY